MDIGNKRIHSLQHQNILLSKNEYFNFKSYTRYVNDNEELEPTVWIDVYSLVDFLQIKLDEIDMVLLKCNEYIWTWEQIRHDLPMDGCDSKERFVNTSGILKFIEFTSRDDGLDISKLFENILIPLLEHPNDPFRISKKVQTFF